MCKKHKKKIYELIYTCENCGNRYCKKCKQYERLVEKRFSNHYLKLEFSKLKEYVKSLNLCRDCFNLIDDVYNKDRYDPKKKTHTWRDIFLIFNFAFLGIWLPVSIILFIEYIDTGINLELALWILLPPIICSIIFNLFGGLIPYIIFKKGKVNKLMKLSRFFESFGNYCPICGAKIDIYERYCENCKNL